MDPAAFPDGTMRAEADALRVEALSAKGDPDAKAAAEAFQKEHPDSPLVDRVEAVTQP